MRPLPDLGGQDGSFLLVALVLPVMLLFTSFAVDVAGIYVHRRHLQMQADAAALAGASKLQVVNCDDAVIQAESDKYAGVASSTYNRPRVQEEADRVSRAYAHPPCSPPAGGARAVDISVTETGIPLHFPLAFQDADVSARARVELMQLSGASGMLPIALEEDKIKRVAVTLFDERKSPETDPLAQTRTLATVAGSDDGTTVTWGNGGNPFTRDVTESSLGMRVTIERATGTSSYDLGSSAGLLHIHGFEQVAPVQAGAPPALEDVQLTPGTGCAGDNGYFIAAGCRVRVRARVDWDDALTLSTDAAVRAHLGGDDVSLTRTTGDWWEGELEPTGEGPRPLTLDWRQRAGSTTGGVKCGINAGAIKIPGCFGVFKGEQAAGVYTGATLDASQATPVHRTFIASEERSEDIAFVKALESSAVTNSVERCGGAVTACRHSWTVYLGLPSPLQLGSHRVLTVAEPGSNDGHLNCDPAEGTGAQDFQDMLATGCKPMYTINEGEPCPDVSAFGPGLPEPWSCVPSAAGDMTSAVGRGMDRRVYGSTNPTLTECIANRNKWPNWEAGERRIVLVMIVRPPELSANGRKVFPVKDFAFLYVKGLSNNGANGSCPVTSTLNEPVLRNGIAGYFIKYAVPNDGRAIGDGVCSDESIGGCVPVMTE